MFLKFFNADQFCNQLPEITNSKIFESGKFSKNGLFSQQIFGPVKSFCCACNRITYRGRFTTEDKCKICDVDITTSEERRKRYARIALPFPVLNPIFYYILTQSKSSTKTILNNLLSYNGMYYFDDKGFLKPAVEPEERNRDDVLNGLDGAISLIDFYIEDEDGPQFQFLRDNFDKISLSNIIVIPPDFRPSGNNKSGVRIMDEINQIYSTLIIRSNHMKQLPFKVTENDDIYKTNFKHIQTLVIKLYDYILGKMSKKSGLIRSNILGKRVDFSGRAVISPDPTLKIDECRIPYWMILDILKPQLVSYLVNRRVCKRYNDSVKLIEDCLRNQDTQLFDLVNEFCEDKVCILNRQPTLHRLSVLAFKVSIHLGNTIQIHPMVCHPYNADFDGDAMAVYFPITKESYYDVMDKIGIWNNLISPTDITLVPQPNQDIILGVYTATKDSKSQDMREIKGTTLSFGRYLFNNCLPRDYRVVNEKVSKNKLMTILNDIALRYPPYIVMETLDKVKSLGFMLSTIEGYTLSISDLYSEELEEISKNLTGKVAEDHKRMRDKEVDEILHNLHFSNYIESGARGSWEQAKQLVLSRGYVADANNNIRPTLIRNSFVGGLKQEDFFNSSYGARKGLLDTALSTGDSGYLTRQLIYSTVTLEIDDIDDCGTTDHLSVQVKDQSMARSLLWRFYIDDNNNLTKITTQNYKDIIGKTIKLRSPIYCKNEKICKKCYGDLYKILHSEQIGIVATQAVGERTTQLVLRTFHTSGVAQISEQSGDQDDIITGMAVANKLFHKPQSLKQINTPEDLVLMIYDLFNPYKKILRVHYEVIVSSMMWHKDKLWRLYEDRDTVPFEWTSILQIPGKNSWLLGAAFSNLKNKLLDGLIHSKKDLPTSLSRLFRF